MTDTTSRPVSDRAAQRASAAARRQARLSERSRSDNGSNASDPVRQYLREIGRVDLLTAQDEVELGTRIKSGMAAADTLAQHAEAGTSLAAGERRRLQEQAVDGEKAKDRLVQANLRLVVSIAKRYGGRGLHLLDLVQEGNMGLMRATEKFDHTKGFKFSTYASWWIRQAIHRAIADQARTIRIPVHMVESINRVTRVQRQVVQELERDPTVEELAERTGMDANRVQEVLMLATDPLSLDSPVGDEDDAFLGDFIKDEVLEGPSDAATRQMLQDAVKGILDDLTERERRVMQLRFGLAEGARVHTLEEVGDLLGVTRERVRQIESKTLAKLRHPDTAPRLRDYLDGE